jgi:ADP-ribosylglycohydrolase
VNHGLSGGVAGLDDLEYVKSIDPVQGSFGEMKFWKGATCHIPHSLPLSVHLIVKYGNMDVASCVEKAAIANAMLGGDSCTRALLVGLVLGARPGAVVPQRWIETLRTLSIHTVTRVSFQRSNLLALQMLQKSIASASPL